MCNKCYQYGYGHWQVMLPARKVLASLASPRDQLTALRPQHNHLSMAKAREASPKAISHVFFFTINQFEESSSHENAAYMTQRVGYNQVPPPTSLVGSGPIPAQVPVPEDEEGPKMALDA